MALYRFNNAYRNTVGSIQIAGDAGAPGRAAFTLRYGHGVSHFPTDGGGNPVDHNQFSTERSVAAGLEASRRTGRAGSLHLQAVAARLEQGFTNRADSPADTTGFAFIDDRRGVTWRRGIDARLDWRLPSNALLSFGSGVEHETDSEHEIGVSNFGFGASHDTSDFIARRTTEDAFLQLLSDTHSPLSLQAGARVDHNSAFRSFGTWRVGTTWHPTPATRIWAAAGTAFKAPTFSQQFARSAFEVGNAALTPERSRSGEIGATIDGARRRLRLEVTAFWQRFRDLIQYVNAAPGEPTYVNLGAATSRGVEATARASIGARLTLSAHWTWLHTEVTDTGAASSLAFREGAALIRRPGSSGGGQAAWHAGRFMLSGTVVRVGSRDDIDFSGATGSRVILRAYTTIDIALEAPLRRAEGRLPGFDLTLRGENVFDAEYQQAVGFPGRRRTLLGGGRFRF